MHKYKDDELFVKKKKKKIYPNVKLREKKMHI